MSRTMFVNPQLFSNPRKRRKKGKKSKARRRARRRFGRFGVQGGMTLYRRNAGIAPFVQNPLILSNPVKRRRRRANPMALPKLRTSLENGLSYGGGAALALTANTLGLNKIQNTWGRRGAQVGTAIVGGIMMSRKSQSLGGAFAGAMMYPFLQDLAADMLGVGVAAGVATAKEADLEALAADLEDVMEEMEEEDEETDIEDGDDDLELW